MTEERLTRADARSLLAWVVAGIVGLAVAVALFPLAFPLAAVDFRVSPQDATRIAGEFLERQGLSVQGYTSSTLLGVDEDAQFYLERELGVGRANALVAGDVPVFAFRVRFFRDFQQEEFDVRVDPSGRVVGMRHVVEEARPGPSLERDRAREVAERFLREAESRFAEYAFLAEEASSIERPARRDWTFAWERRGFRAGEAPYRIRVTVLGETVGAFEQSLKVPEAWKRDFDRLRSENFLYQALAQLVAVPFYAGALVVLVVLARRGAIRWRRTMVLAVVLGGIFAATQLNALPLAAAFYDTRESYPGFLLRLTALAVAIGILAAALVALAWTAGEPAYRERWPERLRLASAWRFRALRSREFFRACVIGLALAGAHLGGFVLFYVVGRQLGVWSPQDVRYSDVLSSAVPWLYPLGISVLAATHEEFVFRLFAIPLLLRVTRSPLVAVVAPALVWGFLHSSYPVEPGFVRGIEVGAIGVVAGWVFLRWGILPTLVWHYTVDAGVIGLLLLRSENLYFQVSAAVVGLGVALPLALAAALYLARGAFLRDPALLNAAEPVPAPPAVAAPAVGTRYEPATRRALAIALGAGAVGALAYALMRPDFIGSFVRVATTADEAARRADAALAARGVDPRAYRKVATFGSYPTELRLFPRGTQAQPEEQRPPPTGFDPLANEYLRREVGIEGANRFYAEAVPSAFWRVRYFRDSEKEDYVLLVRPDGEPFALWHRRDEATPGPSLSREEAQEVVERYLREEQRLDLARWRLVEAAAEKLPARTDHILVWERAEGIGEARARAEVRLAGDEVASYRVFVKLPEDWERRQRERGLADVATGVLRALAFGALAIFALVLFFRNVRRAPIPWRALVLPAAVGAAAILLSLANEGPGLLAQYATEIPLVTFAALLAFGNLAFVALVFGALFLLCGAAWLFAALAFGGDRPTLWRGLPRAYYRDAFVFGLAGGATLLGLSRLREIADALWPTDRVSTPGALPGAVDALVPAAAPLGTFAFAITVTALVGLAAALLARYTRPPVAAGLLVLLAVVLAWEPGPPESVVKGIAVTLAQLAVIAIGVARVVRFNALAYVLAAATPAFVGSALSLARQPHPLYLAHAILLAGALVLLFAVPLAAWRLRRTRSAA